MAGLPLNEKERLAGLQREEIMVSRRPAAYYQALGNISNISDLTGFLKLPPPGPLDNHCLTPEEGQDPLDSFEDSFANFNPGALVLLPRHRYSDQALERLQRLAATAELGVLASRRSDDGLFCFLKGPEEGQWQLPDEGGLYDGFPMLHFGPAKIMISPLKELTHPELALSAAKGGCDLRTDCEYLYNHQSCEPAGHSHGQRYSKAARDPEGYRDDICASHGLPPQACATLGTAANMHLAHIEELSFRDLTVLAVVTGGVESNAGRAGDPAFSWEGPDGFESLKPDDAENGEPRPGTINTMLFINQPLTPGALTRTIMTATEAKSAALQELAVNSRYSDGLATGTDQIGVAAAMTPGRRPLTGAGKHSKLGELIGRAVKAAVKGTLLRQNGMSPDRQCSVKTHLERFGLNTQSLVALISENLSESEAALLRCNYRGLFHDPPTVAAAAALAHLKDKFIWGILPPLVWSDVMGSFAAQAAAAVSGKYEKLAEYRTALAPLAAENSNRHFIRLAARALAMGFKDKWS